MGVYAYTGTWLADFPMNHYTHWVGILLKPSQKEVSPSSKKNYTHWVGILLKPSQREVKSPSAITIFVLILSTTCCQDEILEEKARTELE